MSDNQNTDSMLVARLEEAARLVEIAPGRIFELGQGERLQDYGLADLLREAAHELRDRSGPYLKPCPFCGGTDVGVQGNKEESGMFRSFVTCSECAARGPTDFGNCITVEEPSRLWNLGRQS